MSDAFEMARATAKHRLRLVSRVAAKVEKENKMAKRLAITETFDIFDPEDQAVTDLAKRMVEQVGHLESDGYRDITIVSKYRIHITKV